MQLKPNVCNYRCSNFFQTFYDMNDNPLDKFGTVYTIDYNGMDYLNIEFVPYEV